MKQKGSDALLQEKPSIRIYLREDADESALEEIKRRFEVQVLSGMPEKKEDVPVLVLGQKGLALEGNGQAVRGDFRRMLRRAVPNNLNRELLVKAARLKGIEGPLTAADATAGLGEDSFLLAAAGFRVFLYERDAVIAALLSDALRRAASDPELAPVTARMTLHAEDSLRAFPELTEAPDVIVLDPMFPARQKSALIKKKFQLLQQLESPCPDEEELLKASIAARPRRIIIKRPLKGPYLSGHRPDYSLEGTSIRYDCIVLQREG
jgi:16S rRNA (guanine1516-N2)-methyltransferase